MTSNRRSVPTSSDEPSSNEISVGETPPNKRFRVEVRLMVEPCLWCWEIRDTIRETVVNSSWADDWAAYDSAQEAFGGANHRLMALDRSLRNPVGKPHPQRRKAD